MDQVALYRKYRPQNFDNLVGQDHIKETLMNAIKTNHVSHAYLFTGPRGTGKTSTARLIAKVLNCTNLIDGFEPCGECEFCTDINEGKLIDLIEIDAASNRGIDEVRDLKEKINFSPTRAKYKIYIIDEVHMMTKEAFNALLKTLEEPPPHAYFILATTEVHKIPETIISRCQRFDFKRITIKALMTRLSFIAQKEGIEAEDQALELISRYVNGGLRDAISLIEQLNKDGSLTLSHVQDILGVSSTSVLEEFFEALNAKDVNTSLKIVNELHSQGSDLKQFVHEFVDMLRTRMLTNISADQNEEVKPLIDMIEIFQKIQDKLQHSSIPQLPLEIAVIQIAGEFTKEKSEEKEIKIVTPSKKRVKEESVQDRQEQEEKEEKITDKESDKSADEDVNLSLDLKTLREKWPRITERIKSPALKMSLREGLPASVDNSKILLEFNTVFHKDKVMEHDYRVELESVIEEIFGARVKITAKIKPLEINPVVNEDAFLDQAMEIFGGEIKD